MDSGDSLRDDAREAAAPGMRVVRFGLCFGWLHLPAGGVVRDTAVVLCAGLRADARNGHRAFRLLANALARAGFAVLRFDYPGTGNSDDPASRHSDGPELLSVWLDSIHAAAHAVRAASGASGVALCGLRFGATLAALAAEARDDVRALILLGPVTRGRSYIRQLTIEANVASPALTANAGLAAHELQLSGETVRRIAALDMRAFALDPACRVVIHAEAATPVVDACIEAWRLRGATVDRADFAGLEAIIRPSFMSHEKAADVSRIVAWLVAATPDAKASRGRQSVRGAADTQAPPAAETPLRFGPDGALFGVLSRPAGVVADPTLVVLIGNSGGDPLYGTARFGVVLSRAMAQNGIASLRMDFAGLGDSIAPGDAETHVFETDRRQDFAAAIDALTALGFRRFAVQGLCSGAYHAFHAALSDPRIETLLLVNAPMFQWRAGDPIEFLNHATTAPLDFLRQLSARKVWRRVREGRFDVRDRVWMQAKWLAGKSRDLVWRAAGTIGIARPANFAQRSMSRLAARSKTLFLFAQGDPGLTAFAGAFGQGQTPQGATLRIVPDLDHILTTREMQLRVAAEITNFLKPAPE